MYPIARYLSSEIYHTTLANKYNDFPILDISLDHGNISRYFSNLGFKVKRFSTKKKEQNLEKDFDILLNCPIESDNSPKKTWAIILDTRNLQKEVIEYLKIADIKYQCILSWEDNIEYLPQNKCYTKIKIFDSVWCEKKVEGFILKKQEIERDYGHEKG